MLRNKIFILLVFGMVFTLVTGCASSTPDDKFFGSLSTAKITIEKSMTLYKTMDIYGPIIQTVEPGEYKVVDAVEDKNDQGTWILIEVDGTKRGYILGTVFKIE